MTDEQKESVRNHQVNPLTLAKELTLDELENQLIDVLNYGDYLAEALKLHADFCLMEEKEYDQKAIIQQSSQVVKEFKDAGTREKKVNLLLANEHRQLEASKSQEKYLERLWKGNQSKIEALRTIISSRKQAIENNRLR